MYTQNESGNSKVINNAEFHLRLTDEATAKIKLVDNAKRDKVVYDFTAKLSTLIKEYDEALYSLIEEDEAPHPTFPTNPTNPYALDVCGCDCKTCKICYRLLEGEKLTAQDLKDADVSLRQIAFSLMLAVEADEISPEKAASLMSYLIGVTS